MRLKGAGQPQFAKNEQRHFSTTPKTLPRKRHMRMRFSPSGFVSHVGIGTKYFRLRDQGWCFPNNAAEFPDETHLNASFPTMSSRRRD